MNRKAITAAVTAAVSNYLQDAQYSVYEEISVEHGARRRADLLAIGKDHDVMLVEVKSCAQDFRSDTKWIEYLESCNRMYLAISRDFYKTDAGQEAAKGVAQKGVGLMTVCLKTNKVKVKRTADYRHVDEQHMQLLLFHMAYRGGAHKTKVPKVRRRRAKEPEKKLFDRNFNKGRKKTRRNLEQYEPERKPVKKTLFGPKI